VLAKGHLSPSLARAQATVQQVGEWMSGLWHSQVQAHLAQMQQAQEPQQEASYAAA
jgi:simple sugar transport system ATP-binding protein